MSRTSVVALALVGVGALLGAAAERFRELPEVRAVSPTPVVARDLQTPELRAALQGAQDQVAQLTGDLGDVERRLALARDERDRAVDARGNLGRLVRALEADATRLQGELSEASAHRDALLLALAEAATALRDQAAEAEALAAEVSAWRDATVAASWRGFVSDALVQVCDRGTARRHARCRDAVDAALDPALREAFEGCAASGQSLPVLRRAGPDEGLPDRGVWLEGEARHDTQDWYVLLCGPTLPEASAGEGGS